METANQLPSWVIWLNALLTPMIAVAVVAVGYWQARVNANRLKLELFEKRLAKFQALQNLVRAIIAKRYPDDNELVDFRKGIDGVKFLFAEDIENYLEQWWQKAVILNTNHLALSGQPLDEERRKLLDEINSAFRWCAEEAGVLTKPFEKYLKLRSGFRH